MVSSRNFLLIFLSVIVFNFSCSLNSNNQNIKTQDLEVKNVEPIEPANQNWDESIAKITTSADVNESPESKNWKRKKIAELIKATGDELTVENITEKRDMSQYADGGHIDCHGFRCNQREIPKFIWRHWTKKKRGYIRATYSGIDVVWTEHIFIEPNEKGEWGILWRVVREQVSMPSEYWLDDAVEIVSVDRIRINSRYEKYKLVFKNKHGETTRTVSF